MSKIKVRFAPSPTGPLHIGGARSALFNYLYALSVEGDLVLRMEDTDLDRSKAEYEQEIIESLHWLGIEWNEGIEVGGPRNLTGKRKGKVSTRNTLSSYLTQVRLIIVFVLKKNWNKSDRN